MLIDCFKTIEYIRFRFWSEYHTCLFFFDFFFKKDLKSIAFLFVCERGVILRNCLVLTKDVFQKPGTTVKSSNKEWTNTSLRNRDSTKWRLDLDSEWLKTPRTTLILIKLLLYERFGTNFKLSSQFYCCISKLKPYFLAENWTRTSSMESNKSNTEPCSPLATPCFWAIYYAQ